MPPIDAPISIDLKKDEALTIRWGDGRVSRYEIGYLRRMSPSADARHLRDEIETNPLVILPSSRVGRGEGSGGVVATDAELVGNYAIRITFSDGHSTGIYSWRYLREIDPEKER
ncbi:MAG: gamma-butyrobetaine hydroxylase-like domain-containing protein [Phycisphaerales bacterium]